MEIQFLERLLDAAGPSGFEVRPARVWRQEAEAFADRLHEPYRGPLSPVYGPIKAELPSGAVGATISGSGPTVLVWARAGEAALCQEELAARFPAASVLRLSVVAAGAGPL